MSQQQESRDEVEGRLESLADHFVMAHPELGPRLERRLLLVERMYRLTRGLSRTGDDTPQPAKNLSAATLQFAPGAHHPDPNRPNDFEVLRLLGVGAFSRVYLARQKSLDRLVALKVSLDPNHEARTLASLEHDHIVRVFSETVNEQRGWRLLCLQYVPGTTLDRLIQQLRRLPPERRSGRVILAAIDTLSCEPVALDAVALREREFLAGCDFMEAVCWLGARLAEALAHAHRQGVLHRDVKPSNVLLNRYGRPLLTDFNLAFHRHTPGPFGGTPTYMAPEHLDAFYPAEGALPEVVDARSDVYSLGVVLFELLTGERPFAAAPSDLRAGEALRAQAAERRAEAPSPRRRRPEVPAVLDRVVRRCLEPDPEQRYQTAAELAEVLDGCRELRGVERALPAPGPLSRAALRWPCLVAFFLPLLPHLVGGTIVVVYTALWVASHTCQERLQTVLVPLALGYALVAVPLLAIATCTLSAPILRSLRRLMDSERVDAGWLATERRWIAALPGRSLLLSALGWLPASGLLALLAWKKLPAGCGGEVLLHSLLSFTIAGMIALTWTVLAMQFLVLVFYPTFQRDPRRPRQTSRAELGPVSRRLLVVQLLAGLVPLAACIALLTALLRASPADLATPGYRTFQLLVLMLLVFGMCGCFLVTLFNAWLRHTYAMLVGLGISTGDFEKEF
jgi:serine/threonine protein kinase